MKPAHSQVFTIREAARHLGISIDTLRRYDKGGILSPIRTPGNQRRYTIEQLDEFTQRKNKKRLNFFKIKEAGEYLGVSIDTLRRWEKAGKLNPQRTQGNQRRYFLTELSQLKNKPLVVKEVSQNRGIIQPVLQRELLQEAKSNVQIEYQPIEPIGNISYLKIFLQASGRREKGIIILSLFMVSILGFMFFSHLLIGGSTSKIAHQTEKSDSILASLSDASVLGSSTRGISYILKINAPTTFSESATFSADLQVNGLSNLFGGVVTDNQDVNAGTGKLTASNVIYTITAGSGLSSTGGQNPILSALGGVTKVNNVSGELTINGGGSASVTTNGSTITVSSNGITSESDTLASVTGRGATTSTASTFSGGITTGDIMPYVAGTGTASSHAAFTTHTVDSGDQVGNISTSLAIGPDGFGRMAFSSEDSSFNFNLYFLRCTNKECTEKVLTTLASNTQAANAVVAIGTDGFARIAYNDWNNDAGIHFIRCKDIDCTTRTTRLIEGDGNFTQGAYSTAIVMGNDDLPRIAYDGGNDQQVHLARCTDADCTSPVINSVGSTYNYSNKTIGLAIGSDGFARLVSPSNNDLALYFIRCTDINCTSPVQTIVDSDSGGSAPGGYGTGIKMGEDGFAKIGYQANNVIYYADCTNINCTNPSIVRLGSDYSPYGGMGFDLTSNGSPAFSYEEYDDFNGYLEYATCSDDSCANVTKTLVDNSQTAVANNGNVLVFDSDDHAHIAYSDNNYPSSHLHYAYMTSVDQTAAITGGTNIGSQALPFGQIFTQGLTVESSAQTAQLTTGDILALNSDGNLGSITKVLTLFNDAHDGVAIGKGTDGFPRIAYAGNQGTDALWFYTCYDINCASFTPTYIVGESGDTEARPSMARGTDGFFRIVYYSGDFNGLRMVRCTNSDCTANIITDLFSGNMGNNGSNIKIGSDGFPRIAYYDADNQEIKYLKCTSADCTGDTPTTLNEPDGVTYNYVAFSMDLGSDDRARIIYTDNLTQDLKLARCTTDNCSSATFTNVDHSGTGLGFYGIKIVLAPDDTPRIAEIDGNGNQNLSFIDCTDQDCATNPTITGIEPAEGTYDNISMALASDGTARIIFEDSINEDVNLAICSNELCSSHSLKRITTSMDQAGIFGMDVAIDSSDLPITAYIGNSGMLYYARFANASGNKIAGPGIGTSTGYFGQGYLQGLTLNGDSSNSILSVTGTTPYGTPLVTFNQLQAPGNSPTIVDFQSQGNSVATLFSNGYFNIGDGNNSTGQLAIDNVTVCTSSGCTPTGGGGNQWTTNGSSIYYNGGNVGIGTANPQVPLDVIGQEYIRDNATLASATSGIKMVAVGGVNYIESAGAAMGSGTAADLRFTNMNAGTSWMTIQGSTGNVGIGTTNPQFALDINGTTKTIGNSAGALNIFGQLASTNQSSAGKISLTTGNGHYPAGDAIISGGTSSDFYGDLSGAQITAKGFNYSGNSNIILKLGRSTNGFTDGTNFLYVNDNFGNTRMTVADTGNVGIGTSVPSGLLDVRVQTGSSSNQATVGAGASATAIDSCCGTNPTYAIDGNDSTPWMSATQFSGGNPWLLIDLGAAKYITGFRLLEPASDSHDMTQYKIESSNDQFGWVVQYTSSSGLSGGNTGVVSFTSSATARYWRITGLSGNGCCGTQVDTFELWGKSLAPLFIVDTTGNVGVANTSPGSLFTVGSTSQFTVDNTGIVTVSDAGSASPSGYIKLAHGAYLPGYLQNFFGETRLSVNAASANIGGSGSIYSNSDIASQLALSSLGDFQFQVASSGTAGNPVTWTTALDVKNSGLVGIGTITPRSTLDVVGNSSATSSAFIENSTTTAASVGLTIKMGATTPGTTTHLVNFLDQSGRIRGSINFASTSTVAYQTSGIADFAEFLKKDPNQNIEWGSILCENSDGNVEPCSQGSSHIIGVASEVPTFVGGEDKGPNSITVGLSGVVLTKVSTQSGEIKAGDYITTSNSPGVGVKQTGVGQVVGIALQGFTGGLDQIGKISVRVNPSWYDPSVYLTSKGDLNVDTNKKTDQIQATIDQSSNYNHSVLGNATQSASLIPQASGSALSTNENATVSGDLKVFGNGVFNGMLTVLTSIMSPNLIVSDFATFFHDVVFKGNVRFETPPTFSKDTGGFAIVNKDSNTVSVIFQQEYLDVPIITANISLDNSGHPEGQKKIKDLIFNGNISYMITDSTTKGFTLQLNKPAPLDIRFSWLAISVKDAKTQSSDTNPNSNNEVSTQSAAFQSITNQLNNYSN